MVLDVTLIVVVLLVSHCMVGFIFHYIGYESGRESGIIDGANSSEGQIVNLLDELNENEEKLREIRDEITEFLGDGESTIQIPWKVMTGTTGTEWKIARKNAARELERTSGQEAKN